MARIIDADALIELIQSGFDLEFDEVTEKALIQMINEQDTLGECYIIPKNGVWEVNGIDILKVIQRSLSNIPTGHSELFAVVNGKECYVVRDEFGRIVVSDELMRELMRELIERAYGSSATENEP